MNSIDDQSASHSNLENGELNFCDDECPNCSSAKEACRKAMLECSDLSAKLQDFDQLKPEYEEYRKTVGRSDIYLADLLDKNNESEATISRLRSELSQAVIVAGDAQKRLATLEEKEEQFSDAIRQKNNTQEKLSRMSNASSTLRRKCEEQYDIISSITDLYQKEQKKNEDLKNSYQKLESEKAQWKNQLAAQKKYLPSLFDAIREISRSDEYSHLALKIRKKIDKLKLAEAQMILLGTSAATVSDDEADRLETLMLNGRESLPHQTENEAPSSSQAHSSNNIKTSHAGNALARKRGSKETSRGKLGASHIADISLLNDNAEKALRKKIHREDTVHDSSTSTSTIHGRKTLSVREQQQISSSLSVKERVNLMRLKDKLKTANDSALPQTSLNSSVPESCNYEPIDNEDPGELYSGHACTNSNDLTDSDIIRKLLQSLVNEVAGVKPKPVTQPLAETKYRNNQKFRPADKPAMVEGNTNNTSDLSINKNNSEIARKQLSCFLKTLTVEMGYPIGNISKWQDILDKLSTKFKKLPTGCNNLKTIYQAEPETSFSSMSISLSRNMQNDSDYQLSPSDIMENRSLESSIIAENAHSRIDSETTAPEKDSASLDEPMDGVRKLPNRAYRTRSRASQAGMKNSLNMQRESPVLITPVKRRGRPPKRKADQPQVTEFISHSVPLIPCLRHSGRLHSAETSATADTGSINPEVCDAESQKKPIGTHQSSTGRHSPPETATPMLHIATNSNTESVNEESESRPLHAVDESGASNPKSANTDADNSHESGVSLKKKPCFRSRHGSIEVPLSSKVPIMDVLKKSIVVSQKDKCKSGVLEIVDEGGASTHEAAVTGAKNSHQSDLEMIRTTRSRSRHSSIEVPSFSKVITRKRMDIGKKLSVQSSNEESVSATLKTAESAAVNIPGETCSKTLKATNVDSDDYRASDVKPKKKPLFGIHHEISSSSRTTEMPVLGMSSMESFNNDSESESLKIADDSYEDSSTVVDIDSSTFGGEGSATTRRRIGSNLPRISIALPSSSLSNTMENHGVLRKAKGSILANLRSQMSKGCNLTSVTKRLTKSMNDPKSKVKEIAAPVVKRDTRKSSSKLLTVSAPVAPSRIQKPISAPPSKLNSASHTAYPVKSTSAMYNETDNGVLKAEILLDSVLSLSSVEVEKLPFERRSAISSIAPNHFVKAFSKLLLKRSAPDQWFFIDTAYRKKSAKAEIKLNNKDEELYLENANEFAEFDVDFLWLPLARELVRDISDRSSVSHTLYARVIRVIAHCLRFSKNANPDAHQIDQLLKALFFDLIQRNGAEKNVVYFLLCFDEADITFLRTEEYIKQLQIVSVISNSEVLQWVFQLVFPALSNVVLYPNDELRSKWISDAESTLTNLESVSFSLSEENIVQVSEKYSCALYHVAFLSAMAYFYFDHARRKQMRDKWTSELLMLATELLQHFQIPIDDGKVFAESVHTMVPLEERRAIHFCSSIHRITAIFVNIYSLGNEGRSFVLGMAEQLTPSVNLVREIRASIQQVTNKHRNSEDDAFRSCALLEHSLDSFCKFCQRLTQFSIQP